MTKMTKLERLDEKLWKAKETLSDAVNMKFPVGTRVAVNWSRGLMYGYISAESSFLSAGYVVVRSDKGGFHSKHFSDVRKI